MQPGHRVPLLRRQHAVVLRSVIDGLVAKTRLRTLAGGIS